MGKQQEEHNDINSGCCGCCSPMVRNIVVASTVVLLLVFGFVGIFAGDAIATLAMTTEMTLLNWHSQLFRTWQDESNMDINIYRRYYFFNLTNPREVYFDRVTPDLEVIGPFTYKTNRARPMESIYWDVHDDVNFRYTDYQVFVPEKSINERDKRQLDPSDQISTINMALFTATFRVSKIPKFRVNITKKGKGYVDKKDICLLLDIEHLAAHHRAFGPRGIFTQHSVHEWLFGYKDDTLVMLHDGSKIIDYHVPIYFHLQFNDSIPAPGGISFRHGQVCPLANDEVLCNQTLYHDSSVTSGRKWTEDGSSKVDIKHVGTMQKWAGNDKLFWFGDGDGHGDCQRIRGTEGLFVGTNLDKKSTPEIFVDGMYRSVRLAFMQDSEVQGIKTLRFGLDPTENEADPAKNPNARCYHQNYYGALLNMSPVAFAPGIITSKYFFPMKPTEKFMDSSYGAPRQSLLNFTLRDVHHPNKKIHIQDLLADKNLNPDDYTSHLDLHALTGSTCAARSLMQINTMLRPIIIDGCEDSFADMMPQQRKAADGELYTSYFPETALPMVLVDRVALAPPKIIAFLKSHVETPLLVLRVAGYLFIAAAVVICGVLAVRKWMMMNDKKNNSEEYQQLTGTPDEDQRAQSSGSPVGTVKSMNTLVNGKQ